MVLLLTGSSGVLLGFFLTAFLAIYYDRKSYPKKFIPGPRQWPIIGSLLFMAKYTNPAEAFVALSKKYGDIVTLKLGTLDAIVLSSLDMIREVLMNRSQFFDSRPAFQRFHMLFDNNKDNSMAFSDWSESLRRKREIIGHHTFPKKAFNFFKNVNTVASTEIHSMMTGLKTCVQNEFPEKGSTVFLKPFLMESTFKIFTKYFCNLEITAENASQAKEVIKAFDDVFQEVNSQCVGDLFPILMPICGKGHLPKYGEIIRDFTMNQCVQPRLALLKHRVRLSLPDITEEPDLSLLKIPQRNSIAKMEGLDENSSFINGFMKTNQPAEGVDNLLDEFLVNIGQWEDMSLDNVLFAFEDILGGHSAVANFLSTVIVYLAQNPSVQQRAREEVEQVVGAGEMITLDHKLPYCESIVWESSRCISSLLVPHVANQDTIIGDYPVKKGTIFFLNTVDLNFSADHWDEPHKFKPERFLGEDGSVCKPDHFLPFGTGRRSCLGFKILTYTSALVVANLCSQFLIELDPEENYNLTLGYGTLAVPGNGYGIKLTQLNQ